MNNRERSQMWIFTIMVVVLISLLFCPVVFGQVLASPGSVNGSIFYSDSKTPLALNNLAAGNFVSLINTGTQAVLNTTTDSSGHYVFNTQNIVFNGSSYFQVTAYYNNSGVGHSPIFELSPGTHVSENLSTSRAPTDLITIDSLS